MRIILAGISSVVLVFVAVSVLLGPLEGKLPNSAFSPLIMLSFFAAILICYFAFNKRNERWPYPTIEELENQGLVVSTKFQAKRAFQVEEFEDEGIHYYLELDDGSVLFLSGQHLYDYEPIEDDPEENKERQFPCTGFVVKRHKIKGHTLEIVTHGITFEPEVIAPSFSNNNYRSGNIPGDGNIIRNLSYDEIKRERLNRK